MKKFRLANSFTTSPGKTQKSLQPTYEHSRTKVFITNKAPFELIKIRETVKCIFSSIIKVAQIYIKIKKCTPLFLKI